MSMTTSAINYLGSTINREQQSRMDDAAETLCYAVRNGFGESAAAGLIEFPVKPPEGEAKKLGRLSVMSQDKKRELAAEGHRVKAKGGSILSVAKKRDVCPVSLRNWMLKFCEYAPKRSTK